MADKKMVMIVYNEAVDAEVMEVVSKAGIRNYTKFTGVFGKGAQSGTHLGTEIWPGRNSTIMVACDAQEASALVEGIRQLRKTLAKEGVKAFVMPLEEVS